MAELTYDLMFPNLYLSGIDLPEGKDVTVTIASVQGEDLPLAGTSKTMAKYTISFSDAKKRLVLNKTNAKAIVAHYGKRAADWVGKPITLYRTTCKLKGKVVPCVRVREPQFREEHND